MTGTARTHYASGDYLTRYPEGAKHRLRFDSDFEKPGWAARLPENETSPPHPGTPILFEGEYYEIVGIELLEGGGGRFCYFLDLWDERSPLRAPREISPAACERMRVDQQERQRRERSSWQLKVGSILVGLLSADDQLALERELEVSAARMTLYSALTLLLISVPFTILAMALTFGQGFGAVDPGLEWVRKYQLVFMYLLIESSLRLFSAFQNGEPMGSLPVMLVVESYRTARQNFDPAYRRKRSRLRAERREIKRLFASARDEVVVGGDHALEVTSVLPKPHWTAKKTPILYQGTYYVLAERQEISEGGKPRHRFFLDLHSGETLVAAPQEYDPGEVRALFRDEIRERRGGWVAFFALLGGFLDPGLQDRLATAFGYDPETQTKHSIVWAAVLAALGAYLSATYLLRGIGNFADLVVLVGSVFVLGESIVRWKRFGRGEISGSVLGGFIAPAARLLLRGL